MTSRLAAITLVVIATLAFFYVRIAGSAVVIDETDGVKSAFIVTGDGREQQLYELRSGYFYAIPRLEGTIEVRCRNGQRKQFGYVTGYQNARIRVVGDTPCARLVDA